MPIMLYFGVESLQIAVQSANLSKILEIRDCVILEEKQISFMTVLDFRMLHGSKNLEFQLACKTSTVQLSNFACPWQVLSYFLFTLLVDDLIQKLLPIGKVRVPTDLPGRKIYLSRMTRQHFLPALIVYISCPYPKFFDLHNPVFKPTIVSRYQLQHMRWNFNIIIFTTLNNKCKVHIEKLDLSRGSISVIQSIHHLHSRSGSSKICLNAQPGIFLQTTFQLIKKGQKNEFGVVVYMYLPPTPPPPPLPLCKYSGALRDITFL